MIRHWLATGLVLGLASSSAAAPRVAWAEELSSGEDKVFSEFTAGTDDELDALEESPDLDELKGLDDFLDPELAVLFDADPREVCIRTAAETQELAYRRASRISVFNQGGLFDGGVCWWHSRLQRSSLFLATYRPDLPKPTQKQGKAIINTLVRMNRVVAIPGYVDFNEFSRDFEKEIIARLEAWQRFDGFVGFRWVDGLRGRWRVPARTLQLIMSRIHELVAVKHGILFEKLAFKGMIGAHAYLVIGSRQTASGYELDVIDSNYPQGTQTVAYAKGQRSLFMPDTGAAFVPYLDFRRDPNMISAALRRFCQ